MQTRSGYQFKEMAESGEYPNLAARAGLCRLLVAGKQVGPDFKFISDAVDYRRANALLVGNALPVEFTA